MRSIPAILIFIMGTLFCLACRRVDKKLDAEKFFAIFVANSSDSLMVYCFDKVYGINNVPLLNPCADHQSGLRLPLKISGTSSSFVFESKTRRDTFTVNYTTSYRISANAYEVTYNIINLESTFDSVKTNCIPQLTNYCKGNAGFFAHVYF